MAVFCRKFGVAVVIRTDHCSLEPMSYTPLEEGGRTPAVVFDDEPESHHPAPRRSPELSEPLNDVSDDPFYVFRDDLYRKLEIVDENLAEFLRTVRCLRVVSSLMSI